MKSNIILLAAIFITLTVKSQPLTPEVTSWVINTTSQTGYSGILSNVQKVQYSTNNVYVSATCIPGYDIGPWTGNPNTPANQNFVFKITRSPAKNTGTLTATPLGHVGVWSNGVSIFNAEDARSYNNAGVWNQNAIFVEGSSFDTCLGHPAPNGEYHLHLNPRCLYNDKDNANHSPIIGYAFDGFPIYGAYGFKNTDGSGGISRMRTSYAKRNITKRTTLPDGSTASNAGPDVNGMYPLGYYIEDFLYTSGSGDLDEHNGRFCKTPDYPNGIYAYFVTIDANQTAEYPYTIGETYYGTVQAGNTGPQSGHNTISEQVTTYTKTNGIEIIENTNAINIYPNPSNGFFSFSTYNTASTNSVTSAIIYNSLGELVQQINNIQSNVNYSFDMSDEAVGVYYIKVESAESHTAAKFVLAR